jgi:hypothetical protein
MTLGDQQVNIFPSSLSSNISPHFMALLYVHVLIFLNFLCAFDLEGFMLGSIK